MIFRSWPVRIALGVLFGVAGLLVWIRWEAPIAETPIGTDANAERRTQNAELSNTDSTTIAPVEQGLKNASRDYSSIIIRHSAFLPVPFVSQAPFRVWDLPYKEYCEEASVLTLHYWKQRKPTPPADQLDRDLKDVQAWEEANLGRWEDTTAEEVARILREKFGYTDTRVVRGVTVEMMKVELDAGRPIIVPAAGRELPNPYFRPPGPLYHMLVVIGYDDATGEFITNDVGTNTKGAGLRYAYDDLFDAMGDWDHEREQPDTTRKVMIVVE